MPAHCRCEAACISFAVMYTVADSLCLVSIGPNGDADGERAARAWYTTPRVSRSSPPPALLARMTASLLRVIITRASPLLTVLCIIRSSRLVWIPRPRFAGAFCQTPGCPREQSVPARAAPDCSDVPGTSLSVLHRRPPRSTTTRVPSDHQRAGTCGETREGG